MNYLVAKVIPPDFSYHQKKRFFTHLKHYYWEKTILYKHCADKVIRRCVPEDEMGSILVRPEKFQFLEKGQNRNFDYKVVNFGLKSVIYSLDLR